jgi:hypothetical protein
MKKHMGGCARTSNIGDIDAKKELVEPWMCGRMGLDWRQKEEVAAQWTEKQREIGNDPLTEKAALEQNWRKKATQAKLARAPYQ